MRDQGNKIPIIYTREAVTICDLGRSLQSFMTAIFQKFDFSRHERLTPHVSLCYANSLRAPLLFVCAYEYLMLLLCKATCPLDGGVVSLAV